jgi:hypothetical protein
MKDYNHYNNAPEGLKEISLKEWTFGMFCYCTEKADGRQVRQSESREEEDTFDLCMFSVPNFDNKPLGYAIMRDWFDKETGRNRREAVTRFCRYGTDEDWKSFEGRFAAQFSGDNS